MAADEPEPGGAPPTADIAGSTAHAPPLPPTDALPGVPGYVVLGELGRGGMGVVYKARQTALNRTVALKMILGGTDPRRTTRFLAEAEAVAACHHPNVVQVYESGVYSGCPFIALEYLPGGTLAARLEENGPLAPTDAAALVARVAAGVQAAHDQGIVHRDLKPSNILFADGDPKVTDFGVARRGGSDLTATGAILGTPAYMAPEQARGDTKFVGPAADVWALGVILYECLTGARPFDDDDPLVAVVRVQAEPPTPPRSIAPHVPLDLELVCLKCLEKDPRDRYPSAAALADDLGRFLAGRSVSVRTPGPAERLVKWARRNPKLAGALAVAVVALVVGSVVSVAFGLKSAREAEKADANFRKALANTASFIAVARDLDESLGSNTVVLDRLLRQTEANLDGLRGAEESIEVREVQAALQALATQFHLNQGRTDRALPAADEAIAGYEAVLRSGRDTAEVQAGLWQAVSVRSQIHLTRGQTTPALDDARRALEIAEKLVSGAAEPRWESLRATSLTRLGHVLWERGYFTDGDARHEEALQLRTRLAESTAGGTTEYRRLLARAYHTRGAMLRRRGEAGATAAYRKAYELLEPLAATSATAQFELAETCIQLARSVQQDGDRTTAVGYLDTAARLCDGLLQADPTSGDRGRLRVAVRIVRSDVAPSGGDPLAAVREQLAQIDAVIPICRRYVDADPANAVWRTRLSAMRRLRALRLPVLHRSPAPDVRREVEETAAALWEEDRRWADADPESFSAVEATQHTATVLLTVERWVRGAARAEVIRDTARPLLEFYARRTASDPARAEWRVGAAKARLDAVREYDFAGHAAETEAACRAGLEVIKPVRNAPEALKLLAELALRLGSLQLDRVPTEPHPVPLAASAAAAFREPRELLEQRVSTAPGDMEARRLLKASLQGLATALELQGQPEEADGVRARSRAVRLTSAAALLDSKEYLPRRPRFVTETVIGGVFARQQHAFSRDFVRPAEKQFGRTRTSETAIDLAEAYLTAASETEPTEAGRAAVADCLKKILGVYEKLAALQPLAAEEQQFVAAVRAALDDLTHPPGVPR